jgi:hypothetical protein
MPALRSHRFNSTVSIGLMLLAAANLMQWFLGRHTSLPEDPRDLVVGLMFGLAIGTTLLGLWRLRRST